MEQLSLTDLIGTLRKQWRLIAAVTLAVSVLAWARLYFRVPQEWSASTTIMFERETNSAASNLADLMYSGGALGKRGIGATFQTVLRSRNIRERVANRMNLMEVFGVKTARSAGGRIGGLYETDMTATGIMTIRTTWEGPPEAFCRGPNEEDAPRLAAELANTLVEALREFTQSTEYTRASRERRFLEERLEQTDRELAEAEAALVAYASEHALVSPSSKSNAVSNRVSEMQQREGNLRVNLRGARETEQAALDRLDAQQRMDISSLSEQRNPHIDSLHRRILELQREIAQQTQVEGKSVEHPDVQALQTELDKAQAQLIVELSEDMRPSTRQLTVDPSYRELVKTALDKQLERSGLEAQLAAVRTEKERTLVELSALLPLEAQYAYLQRQVQDKSDAYNKLAGHYEEARLAEARSQDQFSVLDEALPPRRPSAPAISSSVVLTAVVAFMLASLLAFWRQGRIDLNSNEQDAAEGD